MAGAPLFQSNRPLLALRCTFFSVFGPLSRPHPPLLIPEAPQRSPKRRRTAGRCCPLRAARATQPAAPWTSSSPRPFFACCARALYLPFATSRPLPPADPPASLFVPTNYYVPSPPALIPTSLPLCVTQTLLSLPSPSVSQCAAGQERRAARGLPSPLPPFLANNVASTASDEMLCVNTRFSQRNGTSEGGSGGECWHTGGKWRGISMAAALVHHAHLGARAVQRA